MNLSVVIPAYNEADSVETTVAEVVAHADALCDQVEVIVVDDHSTDGTFDRIVALKDPRVRVLRLSRRSGSHAALRAGLAVVQGDGALCLSADGQDNPEALASMLEQFANGAQVVWALRRGREDEPVVARLSAHAFYRVLRKLSGNQSGADLSRADFFLLRRRVYQAINTCPERNTSLFGLIAWLGFEQASVEYDRRPRRTGRSKWDTRRRWRLASDWIIAFSGLPLRLTTVLGFATATLGFCYALFLVANYFFGHPLAGWSSVVVLVLLLAGVQMVMLGVVGEYLLRNLDESRRRPIYFIERRHPE